MSKVIEFLKKVWDIIRIDGVLHICVSALITILFGTFLPIWGASIVALLFGIGKEIYDKVSKKGCAEWHDIICDLVGIGIGALLIFLIEL